MQQTNRISGCRIGLLAATLGTALAVRSLLVIAGPAHAGSTQSSLTVKTLKLELGGPDRFVLLDAEGSEVAVQNVAADGGFPDLVSGSSTTEYGCVCEEDVLYLGPGLCDGASGALEGASCGEDSDCLDTANMQRGCELFADGDRIAVEQYLFFVADPTLKRGRL